MFNGKIDKYEFSYSANDDRIIVYALGSEEPLLYLETGVIEDEKTFHYEIMQWYSTYM